MPVATAGARPCAALWCEEGGHAFSERDPGMKVVQISGTDEAGAPVEESRTMCGGCAPRVSVRRTRPQAAAELSPPPGYQVPDLAHADPRVGVPAAYDPNGWAPAPADVEPRL